MKTQPNKNQFLANVIKITQKVKKIQKHQPTKKNGKIIVDYIFSIFELTINKRKEKKNICFV